jgi:hypothetical protein
MGDFDDGGPAFPAKTAMQTGPSEWRYEGVTLRDYLAAKALVGLYSMIAAGVHDVSRTDPEGDIARHAYLMADAMLRARTGGQP